VSGPSSRLARVPRPPRLVAVLVAVLTTAALVVVARPADAGDRRPVGSPAGAVPRVVSAAQAALVGDGAGDASLALADLRVAYPNLSPAARAAAAPLLARPTDGGADPDQFGWSVAEAAPVCSVSFCVHYVASTEDAPPLADTDANGVPDQVTATLDTLESVLDFHTRVLGYRPPATDGTRGGSAQFDVYLSQLASDGLYGFCAPEQKVAGQKFLYSGYCVLDNDFVEFPRGPLPSLQVTAAHEFFHAIQFAYDATEDRWFMEATATWAEERYADDIDDNRQYLKHGQLGRPRHPLDEFDAFGQGHYGNWVFFERLSQRYGAEAVHQVWDQADATKGAPDLYSTEAIAKVLRRQGTTFAEFYGRFAAGNQLPTQFYEEGFAYRTAPVEGTVRLRAGLRKVTERRRLDHLTSAAYRFEPAGSLHGRWRLRLAVSGPPRVAGTAATVLVEARDGTAELVDVHLNARGGGARSVVVDNDVRAVTLVLTNGSTRFKPCWRGTSYSCQGEPRDDDAAFAFTASLSR
jgi:hypothetical protein